MKKTLSVSGFCPTLSRDHSINVDYIDATTTSSNRREFVKSLFECSIGSYGNCPIVGDCPINKSAPKHI